MNFKIEPLWTKLTGRFVRSTTNRPTFDLTPIELDSLHGHSR